MESESNRIGELARTQLTKWRWAIGLKGLASVVFGVMILLWPGISVFALTIVFGAYALATGIVELGGAFSSRVKQERWALVLSGLLGIVLGTMVLAWPGISALALLYLIGVFAILLGVVTTAGSLWLPLDGGDTALMILSGVVSVLFGIVIFVQPGGGALAVLALIAAFALVTGVSELVLAIGGKQLLEWRMKKAFGPKAVAPPSH
jgi:uncharacterized membrane protein HdeD (DUF308 family)